jgi:hypothetical protein
MPNTNTDTALEVYSNKLIEGLTNALPALRAFSLDLSDELSEPGETVRVPLVSADAAAAWNDTTNNYGRTTASLKDKKVVCNQRIIAGFAITQTQLANFRPAWWEGKAALNARTIADAVLDEVFGVVTAANFGDTAAKKLAVALGAFGRKSIAELRPKVVKGKLQPAKSVLVLNPDFFAALLSDLDAQVYGGREAITGGTIPGLLGFRAIVEAPQLDEPGFVCHPDAIAVGSRRVQVADTTPYKEFGPVTEPDTGLTLNRVIYTDGTIGKTSFSIECLFGADAGNPDSLIRLTA